MPSSIQTLLKVILFLLLTGGIGFGIFCAGFAALVFLGGLGVVVAIAVLIFGFGLWLFILRALFSKTHKGTRLVFAGVFTLVYAFIVWNVANTIVYSLGTYFLFYPLMIAAFVGWLYLIGRFFVKKKDDDTSSVATDTQKIPESRLIPRVLVPAVMYIIDARMQKFPDEETRQMLLSSGWKVEDINEAFIYCN